MNMRQIEISGLAHVRRVPGRLRWRRLQLRLPRALPRQQRRVLANRRLRADILHRAVLLPARYKKSNKQRRKHKNTIFFVRLHWDRRGPLRLRPQPFRHRRRHRPRPPAGRLWRRPLPLRLRALSERRHLLPARHLLHVQLRPRIHRYLKQLHLITNGNIFAFKATCARAT